MLSYGSGQISQGMANVALCFLLFTACSKGNPSVSPEGRNSEPTETDATVKPSSKTSLTSDQRELCAQFFQVLDDGLESHLVFSQKDRPEMITQAIEKIRARNLETEVDESLAQVNGEPEHELKDCEALRELRHDSPWTLSNQEDPFVQNLRAVLAWIFYYADAHSSYTPPHQRPGYVTRTHVGLGLILHERTDYLVGRKPNYVIVKGVHGSNSSDMAKPRVPINTRIWKVEDLQSGELVDVSELRFDEVKAYINQPSGLITVDPPQPATIKLEIELSDGQRAVEAFPVRSYQVASAWGEILSTEEGHTALHFRLQRFRDGMADEFDKIWIGLLMRAGQQGNFKTVILDLRGNGGGYWKEAVDVAQTFLPLGSTVVYSLGKDDQPMPHPTRRAPADLPPGLNLLVLVDGRSASASEVLAAALEDNGYAMVLGQPTWGKGVAQSLIDLPAPLGGRLAIASHYIFSPSGLSHRRYGMQPTITLDDPVLNEAQHEETAWALTLDDQVKRAQINYVIDEPSPLPTRFRPPTQRLFSASVVDQLKTLGLAPPKSCQNSYHDPEFKEEDDCLLDWALRYADALNKLNSTSHANP